MWRHLSRTCILCDEANVQHSMSAFSAAFTCANFKFFLKTEHSGQESHT